MKRTGKTTSEIATLLGVEHSEARGLLLILTECQIIEKRGTYKPEGPAADGKGRRGKGSDLYHARDKAVAMERFSELLDLLFDTPIFTVVENTESVPTENKDPEPLPPPPVVVEPTPVDLA